MEGKDFKGLRALFPGVPEDLRRYVEGEILPRYEGSDPAHGAGHVRQVLENTGELLQGREADPRLAYTAAAYHDLGIVYFGRKGHEATSARLLREDGALGRWFSPEEIETMAQAVEDHRASAGTEPRSLSGKILSEADRDIDPERIVRRCMEYGRARFPDKDAGWQAARAVEHIREKYGEGGYMKLWLHSPRNQAGLETLRRWLATGEIGEVCLRYG